MTYDIATTRVASFHQRHGGEAYSDGGRFYYADGAVRDVDRLGVLIEPPDEDTVPGEYQKALNILTFHELKLARAVGAFDELNTRLSHSTSPDMLDLGKLRKLQQAVTAQQACVKASEDRLHRTRKGRIQQLRREGMEEEQRRLHEFHSLRRAIRI